MKIFRQHATIRHLRAGVFAALSLLGASTLFAASARAEPMPVVTSFTILADMTRQIGGERVQVHSLVGENGNAHAFQPSPSDARRLGSAKLVIINGLGFEGWIERLVRASGYPGKVAVASAGIKALDMPEGCHHHHHHGEHGHDHAHHHDHDHGHSHTHGGSDPHAWQDAGNALQYVDNITAALSEADPDGKALYASNAERYKGEIKALDAVIRQAFAALPEARRRVVTSHDAFAYFGRAYGMKFIAPLGINSEVEPSAREVGWLIRQIRQEQIPAVFMENITDPRLIERISKESGARLGGTLYSDSLSDKNGPAPTYLKMMRYNADTLSAALKP